MNCLSANSISNQKRILETFAKQNGFTNLRWYTDDGYSGANFQRPGFQAMLADIEAGKVGTVIVKDMSRLGRNYLQVGFYTEMLFPQKGVRFIAVNDNVDSANGGMDNDFTPLRNLFNEWLVRDTSKKIKAVKRAKGMSGKPVTSKPVYGYLMDEDENYIVDEETAPVVRQIYQLCLAGNGPTKIARMLTEQQIPTPGTLEYRRTGSTRRYHSGYECKWATNTVVHMFDGWGIPGRYLVFGEKKDLAALKERELTKLSDILAEHDAANMSKALEQASWNLPYIIHGSSFRLLVGSIFELLARYCSLKRRILEVRTEKDFLRLQKQTAKEGDTVPRLCRSWGVPEGEDMTSHDVLERAIRRKHLIPVCEADLVLVCGEDGPDDPEGFEDSEDMDLPDDFDDLDGYDEPDDPGEGWDE